MHDHGRRSGVLDRLRDAVADGAVVVGEEGVGLGVVGVDGQPGQGLVDGVDLDAVALARAIEIVSSAPLSPRRTARSRSAGPAAPR